MTAIRWFAFLILGLVSLSGCTRSSNTPKPDAPKAGAVQSKDTELAPDQEAKLQAALAKLSDADQTLALAQKFCPIQKTRLGSMGKPDRIEIEGQPVFLCCSGCADDARAEPKKTLDQVASFKKEK